MVCFGLHVPDIPPGNGSMVDHSPTVVHFPKGAVLPLGESKVAGDWCLLLKLPGGIPPHGEQNMPKPILICEKA